MRRAFADIAEFESTDDRRSKMADIILSVAHRRKRSYKVSAFTKIKGEHTSFYFTIRSFLPWQSTISRNMHFFPIVCTFSISPLLYVYIPASSSAMSIDDRERSSLFVSTSYYNTRSGISFPLRHRHLPRSAWFEAREKFREFLRYAYRSSSAYNCRRYLFHVFRDHSFHGPERPRFRLTEIAFN